MDLTRVVGAVHESQVGAAVLPVRAADGSQVVGAPARAGGWYAGADVPAEVRTEFDRLDRPRRRSPAV